MEAVATFEVGPDRGQRRGAGGAGVLDAHAGGAGGQPAAVGSFAHQVDELVGFDVEPGEQEGALEPCWSNATTFDSFGTSEAVGLGVSASAPGAEVQTAAFTIGPNCAVFTEDGRRVEPGSGERGLVAVTGFLPVGYYKDPDKTAKTFKTHGRKRAGACPRRLTAEVNADATLKPRPAARSASPLAARRPSRRRPGGGVEDPRPVVRDAVVVGLPDPRFGERICAVVETDGSAQPTLAELSEHVRLTLRWATRRRGDLVLVESYRPRAQRQG